jgi:hypothetical protein
VRNVERRDHKQLSGNYTALILAEARHGEDVMKIRTMVSRNEGTGDKLLYYPCLVIDDEIYQYCLGVRSKDLALQISAQIARDVKAVLLGRLSYLSFTRLDETPNFLVGTE